MTLFLLIKQIIFYSKMVSSFCIKRITCLLIITCLGIFWIRQNMYTFCLMHNISRVMVKSFSSSFFSHLFFGWIIYFFPILFNYKSLIFCGCFLISSWFHKTVAACWKHLSFSYWWDSLLFSFLLNQKIFIYTIHYV